MAVIENDVLMKFKDSSGNVNLLYPITRAEDVDGLQEAIRDQGVITEGTGAVYTATVEGITSLSAGVSFVMIPHTVSTSSSAKLNVNNLGEKFIRRRVSGSTTTTYSAKTSDDWLAAGKPIRVMYDGTQWIADMPVPYAGDFMGTLAINNGGTGATTAAQARTNLGIETNDGTVISGNADYAEVGEWIDGNPDSEDRIGYFVCIDSNTPGTKMRKAKSSDDIRGVTVASPAFAGGCSAGKYTQSESSDPDADSRAALFPQYAYVAVMGIVPVIDDGSCVINGRCMPNDSGIATLVSGDYGYHVIDRIDSTHVLIAVEPGTDFQYKTKKYIDSEVRKAAPVNLLDNSDFRNPVNQRGFVSGTRGSNSYTIDRWILQYDTYLHLHPGYVGISGYWDLKQPVGCKMIAGKTYTFSVEAKSEADNGNMYMKLGEAGKGTENRQAINSNSWSKCVSTWTADRDYEPGECVFFFGINTGIELSTQIYYKNPVVYEGAYTAETLPEYHPKGYTNELLVCRQYDPYTGDYIGLRKFGQPTNLLDNSDFRNPVMQAGFDSLHGSVRYPIDRWYDRYGFGAFTKTDNGITVAYGTNHGYFNQRIANPKQLIGKRLTFAICLYDGTIKLCGGVFDNKTNIAAEMIGSDNIMSIESDAVQIVVTSGSLGLRWAALYEGTYTADTLPEYQPKGYMVEALNCGALHVTTTATITTTWSGSGPYTQAVSVSGILATDMPHITPVYSADNATAIAQKEAWGCVSKAETSANTITFTCFEEKPTTNIPIQIEVMR